MAVPVGFEPTPDGFKDRCSAPELQDRIDEAYLVDLKKSSARNHAT